MVDPGGPGVQAATARAGTPLCGGLQGRLGWGMHKVRAVMPAIDAHDIEDASIVPHLVLPPARSMWQAPGPMAGRRRSRDQPLSPPSTGMMAPVT